MKKHPLIRELQLGKSVHDLVREIGSSEEYDFQRIGTVELENFVKELVKENDPSLRFGVYTSTDGCFIDLMNGRWASRSPFYEILSSYWDEEYNFALDDDADLDCELLNKLVGEIFGPYKLEKKKVTRDQVIRGDGKVCPHCGKRDRELVMDEVTWKNRKVVGCRKCGGTWKIVYKKVAVGYEKGD